jgi:hypothetical protein
MERWMGEVLATIWSREKVEQASEATVKKGSTLGV